MNKCATCGKKISNYRGKRFCGVPCSSEFDFYTFAQAKKAVRELDIRDTKEYARRHHEDPRLPSHPWTKYPEYDCRTFFDKSKHGFHATRRKLAQLNIRSVLEYTTLRRSLADRRLPAWDHIIASPAYKGADHFFSKKNFYSYAEARRAIKKFHIYSCKEYWYLKPYKIDTRLPSDPRKHYKEDWKGWRHFLDCPTLLERKAKQFYSHKRCGDVLREMGVCTSQQFQKVKPHKLNPCIPACPAEYYKSLGVWKGWKKFLNAGTLIERKAKHFYSYEQCQKVLRAMGIYTSEDFQTVKPHKTDPRIPAVPDGFYQPWEGWTQFLRPDMDGQSYYIGKRKRKLKRR